MKLADIPTQAAARTADGGFRQLLADQALADADLSSLMRILNDQAKFEGGTEALVTAAQLLERGLTNEKVYLYLLEQTSRPVDDKWSGRGNDVIRSRREGYAAMVSDLKWVLTD